MSKFTPFTLSSSLRRNIMSAGVILSLSLLCACATTPDPAEICSAEWIKPRSEHAIKELKRDTYSRLKTIASAASKYEAGSGLSAFQMWRMSSAAKGLMRDYETSTALADLKTLSSTCNDPQIAKDAFYGMLEEAGLSEKLIEMFNSFQTLFPEIDEGLDAL